MEIVCRSRLGPTAYLVQLYTLCLSCRATLKHKSAEHFLSVLAPHVIMTLNNMHGRGTSIIAGDSHAVPVVRLCWVA